MHPIWAAHPRTHLSTEYPPPGGTSSPLSSTCSPSNVGIQYSKSELLALRSNASTWIPQDIYSCLKDFGVLRSRGRRAGSHMRRNCHKLSPPRQNSSTLEVSQSDELNASSILSQRSVSAFSLSNNSDNHMNKNFNICQWNARSIRNKATICSDYTLEHDIDIMFLTETWLNENDQVAIGEVTPPGYVFLNIPRGSGDDHGGLGVLYKSTLKLRLIPSSFSSINFEHAIVADKQRNILYVVVYRPPPSKENCLKTSEYLNDFDDFLTFINSFGSKILMLGDFNIHVDTPNKWDAKRFLMSIETAGLYQHIHEPTHKDGHTLDLVLTRLEDNLGKCTSVGPRPSDHHFTHCTLDLYKPTKEKEIRSTRNFKKLNRSSFHSDLSKRFDSAILSTNDTDSLAILYNETIETCLNTHAPW